MTRSEYEERHADLTRRLLSSIRRLISFYLPLTAFLLVWPFWHAYTLHFARQQPAQAIHDHSLFGHPAAWMPGFSSRQGVIRFEAIYLSILLGGMFLSERRIIAATAPRCERCGKSLGPGTRRQVLAEGRCPRCRQPVW